MANLKTWQPSNTSKKELRRTTYNYFAGNAARMRDKTFRDKGCYIGSGIVEAGCKQVVNPTPETRRNALETEDGRSHFGTAGKPTLLQTNRLETLLRYGTLTLP